MPNKQLSRRDILKLASLVPLALVSNMLRSTSLADSVGNSPNVIILVFDAWSARNLRLYGYPRGTMPNLEKFAERAVVFHRHYSAATFTVPGTASLLSSLYPWTHRAINLGSSGVLERHRDHQAFATFSDAYKTLGYAQNKYADIFLYQFKKYLDTHIKSGAFNLEHRYLHTSPLFENDAMAAFASFENNIFQETTGFDSSLLLGPAFRLWKFRERSLNNQAQREEYPRGLPDATEQFLLSDLVDGVLGLLGKVQPPTFAYLHLFPPHDPYAFQRKFVNAFHDGWVPPQKPIHELSEQKPATLLNRSNEYYDEYLADWDAELGRLFDFLHSSGLFDSSYIIITSDHGEIFERGQIGHFTKLIYDPLIHIPLIISQPGQTVRKDVYTATSAVDVLPTLARLTGRPEPDWTEGTLLPSLGGTEDPKRSIYAMDAKTNSEFGPLKHFTISLTKGDYRLTCYKYSESPKFEFYHLKEDPEELTDLYPSQPAIALQMQEELLEKLAEVNKPFEQ
jgi:arylsulfatase A-like enzyme